jgi:hypothetical protein
MAYTTAQLKTLKETHSTMKWDDEIKGSSNTVLYSTAIEHLDNKEEAESVIITAEVQLAAIVYRNYVGEEPRVLKRSGVKDGKQWTAYSMLAADVSTALLAMKEMYS